ncbi:unnamed protein product [Heterobilharzia americana]|nr:unnamed protein product [Heterobilharzia americana]
MEHLHNQSVNDKKLKSSKHIRFSTSPSFSSPASYRCLQKFSIHPPYLNVNCSENLEINSNIDLSRRFYPFNGINQHNFSPSLWTNQKTSIYNENLTQYSFISDLLNLNSLDGNIMK